MPKRMPVEELQAIEAVVRGHPQGISAQGIAEELATDLPRRTLQYRLKYLVDQNRLVKEGEKRWVTYRAAAAQSHPAIAGEVREGAEAEPYIPVSKTSAEIRKYLRRPVYARKPSGYNVEFLNAYQPNISAYLSENERAHLRKIGTPSAAEQPAGTYARRILDRLLIDLSWNSSRLEGNTYSLLDTRRLIHFGEEAQGKARLEAQMILNHKDAIEFLVMSAEELGFNRHTLLNLHALLANNLLPDPDAPGRLRHIAVGIEQSAFYPLEEPQLIEEYFQQILATAAAIKDPFEQSFFVMVQLPYLQPFDDVNKRVSRLAANIPLFQANLIPLSFTAVPTDTYTEAILGIYELNSIDLLKDVYLWAYERSALQYTAIRQSLGEPDPFRLQHRAGMREVIGEVVRACLDKKSASTYIVDWSRNNIESEQRDKFREIAESELLGLHEGNFARYKIRPSEFQTWRKVWNR